MAMLVYFFYFAMCSVMPQMWDHHIKRQSLLPASGPQLCQALLQKYVDIIDCKTMGVVSLMLLIDLWIKFKSRFAAMLFTRSENDKFGQKEGRSFDYL